MLGTTITGETNCVCVLVQTALITCDESDYVILYITNSCYILNIFIVESTIVYISIKQQSVF